MDTVALIHQNHLKLKINLYYGTRG